MDDREHEMGEKRTVSESAVQGLSNELRQTKGALEDTRRREKQVPFSPFSLPSTFPLSPHPLLHLAPIRPMRVSLCHAWLPRMKWGREF